MIFLQQNKQTWKPVHLFSLQAQAWEPKFLIGQSVIRFYQSHTIFLWSLKNLWPLTQTYTKWLSVIHLEYYYLLLLSPVKSALDHEPKINGVKWSFGRRGYFLSDSESMCVSGCKQNNVAT